MSWFSNPTRSPVAVIFLQEACRKDFISHQLMGNELRARDLFIFLVGTLNPKP